MSRKSVLVLALVASIAVGGCTSTRRQAPCVIGDAGSAGTDPDGHIVWNGTNSVGGCSGIFSIHPDGTGFRRLTQLPASELFYNPEVPEFSPDGRLITFVGSCDVEVKPEPDVCVMNSDGTNGHTVAMSGALKIDMRFGATWSPDGTRLAFTRSGSPSSTGANRSVYVIGIDGTGETMLVDHAYGPAWSPDGARIAVVSDREGTDKIYLVGTDGSGLVRLTDGPKDQNPAWSPDGTRVAFESERSGKPILRNASDQNPTLALPPDTAGRDIYVMQADGTGIVRLTEDPAYNVNPAWSPDGMRIAFASNRSGEFQIHVMNADGSDVRQLTRTRYNVEPSWAPDA
jgi:Tol biopolymer transport system component